MGELLALIEQQRVILAQIVKNHDYFLLDNEVIKSSKNLDKLILQYYSHDN